ncbi:class I glutamine amidotransferase-like protein [Ilyonectria destructans]|nr:class I glutamine amidotransferase-like protein [Ilyonectria destructans]
MSRTIHLAILNADIPGRELYQARGLFSSQFERILQEGVAHLNRTEQFKKDSAICIRVTAYDLLGGVYPPFELLRQDRDGCCRAVASGSETDNNQPIDAIWITGAAPGIYETEKYPWIQRLESYIKHVYAEFPQVRILGSCFGHQLIAQALLAEHGALVEKSPWGRQLGLQSIKLNPTFIDHFPLLSTTLRGGLMRMQMMHADWVTFKPGTTEARPNNGTVDTAADLPHPWVNVGCTEQCPIQGLYLPGRVLTVQGHFEMDAFALYSTCMEFAPSLGWSEEYLDIAIKQIGYTPEYQDDAVKMACVVGLFLTGAERGGNYINS